MILLKCIVLLKILLEQMFMDLKEVALSGDREGVIVFGLRNIK